MHRTEKTRGFFRIKVKFHICVHKNCGAQDQELGKSYSKPLVLSLWEQEREEERKRANETGKGKRLTNRRKKAKDFLVSRIKTMKPYVDRA